MVATTFAADTPLAVTGIVIKDGISGNWFWWNFLFGGTLTVFFFAHLWRRAEVITEVEFIDLRYSGSSAKFLRGLKALYLALPVSSITFGWVTLAMVQIFRIIFGMSQTNALAVCIAITVFYTTLSGLWGVVATDVFQFAMAMLGAIVLSVVSVEKVGGISSLLRSVKSISSQTGINYFSTIPSLKESLPLAFFVAIFIQWWAVYYPGAEPGGGGWVAQRMLAARNPKHSVTGTLWFNIAHYVIRPWPWIITALSALILFPDLISAKTANAESAYPMMVKFLPSGIRGLMIASFLAAYMSTIESILNLSASYLVNDFYAPFIKKSATQKHYVAASRVSTILVALCGIAFSLVLGSIKTGWGLIMELSGGIGLVLILRWYWWRINAWSEISAVLASAFMAIYLKIFPNSSLPSSFSSFFERLGFKVSPWGINIILIVLFTTIVWVAVTFLTPPDKLEKLRAFYQKVRPGGFWSRVLVEKERASKLKLHPFLGWLLSILLILFLLQGIGRIIFLRWQEGIIYLLLGGLAGLFLSKIINKINWEVR
jgi:SSS family solute:Na+ symporter